MLFSSKTAPSREKVALSNSYIDENGNLFLYETPLEKKSKQFISVLRELPPILSFLSVSFFIVQLYIVFGGIYYHAQIPPTASEIRIYVFLFLLLGMGMTGCLKLGWFFVEQKEAEYNDIQQQYQTKNKPI